MRIPLLAYAEMRRVAYLPGNALRNLQQTALLIVILLLFAGFVPKSPGQTDDEVHIVPRGKPPTASSPQLPAADSATGNVNLLTAHVDLVLVPVTVADAMNHPVIGLRSDNFTVYEDDQTQHIRYFWAEDTPISVGIVLDLSGTMATRIDAARGALSEFFNNSNPDDDYFVITFADRPQLIADSTRSPEEIQTSIANVVPSGHTALLDAIHMGLAKLRNAHYRRRALLIISDGQDNWSRYKLRQIEKEVEESAVEVYAIGLFNDEFPVLSMLDVRYGKGLLTRVTAASGGRMVTVDNLEKLPEIAAFLSKEMRNEYVLGYQPTNTARNGKWRKIKVRVAPAPGRGDKTVRLYPAYKRGYIAPLQ